MFYEGDCLIYVPADIPADDEAKEKMLTQKDIQRILSEYVNPLLEEPAEVKWYEVRD